MALFEGRRMVPLFLFILFFSFGFFFFFFKIGILWRAFWEEGDGGLGWPQWDCCLFFGSLCFGCKGSLVVCGSCGSSYYELLGVVVFISMQLDFCLVY